MHTTTVSDALSRKVYTDLHLPIPQDHKPLREAHDLLDRMELVLTRQWAGMRQVA